MKVAISVSTYLKNEALKGWLDSLSNFGKFHAVNISDDADGHAEEVAKQYASKIESLTYSTGPNKGIAANKNRGIKFFLEDEKAKECDLLILSDDDIQFGTSEYGEKYFLDWIVKIHEETKLPHLTSFLAGYKDPLSGKPFFDAFKPVMEDEYCYYIPGSQGILLTFTRDAINKAGYFDTECWKSTYGYEHALYSCRVQRLFGYQPIVHPVIKYCYRYFGCQGIPNNYEAQPSPNEKPYQKRLAEVHQGVGLTVRNPGV